MDRKVYDPLIEALDRELKDYYGPRLVTFAIYGSYARNQMRPESDIDILIIADDLPQGRMKRSAEFLALEKKLGFIKQEFSRQNLYPYLSAIFKTPEEAKRRPLIFLDMTEEALIFFDRDNFFKNVLEDFRQRLRELGSKRIWKGKMWYWDLKPDLRPGEVFSL